MDVVFTKGLAVIGLLGVCLAGACNPASPPPATQQKPAYVAGAACAECHEAEAAAWTGSDHDLAMAPATPETVLGDFDEALFTHQGVQTTFFRDGEAFMVRTEGPTGALDTFRVAYTFGVRPLQQYLIAFPGGRYQALTVAWDTEQQRWFSLYPDERVPAGDWLHWTGRGMNWNYMCADCHSTNLERNFDLASNTYRTTYAEVDVGCQACHGPGEAHVAWARLPEPERVHDAGKGLTARLSDPENQRTQVEACAPCHSRRRIVADGFEPGTPYLDHYVPRLLDVDLYFADGQIREEVYVYGSFLQSKMYHNGVRCSDCHDPHSARLKLEGNALCAQCHASADYDTQAHHFHPAGEEGTACVDCHMPERTYMEVDPRRDHSFKVPRPDLTVDLGTPNACTGCHTTRSAAWARDQVVAWYGAERTDGTTYARMFAAGRRRAPEAEQDLATLAADTQQPAIVRATALSLLAGYGTPTALRTAQHALRDRDPLVRVTAVSGFEYATDAQRYEALPPLLADSVRAVRIEAARVLSPVANQRFLRTARTERVELFWSALDEYRQSQQAVVDQPEAHLNLAVLHERLGEPEQAEHAYQTALRLDASFAPAHLNLAMLANQRRVAAQQAGPTGESQRLFEQAETHLRKAVVLQPEVAEVHYTLGLLLAEDATRMEEAAASLHEAARLDPENARVQYNAGLAYQHLEEHDQAERLLLAAYQREPRQPDFIHALAVLYMQQEKWAQALTYTDSLLSVVPSAAANLNQQRAYILQQLGR